MSTKWTDQQKAVFAATDPSTPRKRAVVVIARAGTGKTTTSVEALKRIVKTSKAKERVLACAFNKVIAEELKERFEEVQGVDVSTLHSLGFTLAKEALGPLIVDARSDVVRAKGYAEEVAPGSYLDRIAYPAVELYEKLVECHPELLAVETSGAAVAAAMEALSDRFCIKPEGYVKMEHIVGVASMLVKHLVEDAETSKVISFIGMLAVPLAMGLQPKRWDVVLVDEAQDMSAAQLLLAERCVTDSGQLVFVGDDRQAIYAWRGADSWALERMKKKYSADELKLTLTRRCPKRVVEAAKTLVGDIEAPPDAPEGTVRTIVMEDFFDAVKPGDFVLSRLNAPLVSVYLRLLAAGRPAAIIGKADVGKMLSRLVVRCGGKNRGERVAVVIERARKVTAQEVLVAETAERPSIAAVARDRFEALVALSEGCQTAGALLDKIDRLVNPKATDGDDILIATDVEKIRLSSVHRAKGLEADNVFVLVDTLYLGNKSKFGAETEEKNIHYVALTRAKSTLTLVRS